MLKKSLICILIILIICITPILAQKKSADSSSKTTVPIYISFHWHMHQPIYWPYEDMITTNNRHVYSYDLLDIMFTRSGPYTTWPYDAVKAIADNGLPHGGAQVSFSGSLIENLNAIQNAGMGFSNWSQWYRQGRLLKTNLGNPRLDLVAFGYHHPLMPLCDYQDIRKQIQAHREIVQKTFGSDVAYSKGIFPPENAFAEWIIPAYVDEGIEWAFVDNIHFHRACKAYPWVKGENLVPPNQADQVNVVSTPWVQLNGLWAPSKVNAWGCRPHYVRMIDPTTGQTLVTPSGKQAKMIAVPTERYMGNEDGRGGFGALNYEAVMSQLESYNTDPKHPILLVLHHDGDNYGGGTDSYYHSNFYNFIQWVKANPNRFVATTVQDYLKQFPPDSEDIIHVEPGSWSGADNGDAEFKKWNGDPNSDGYSPDRNSWGVMTAVKNAVLTADNNAPNHANTKSAWRYFLCSQTSCYEYWDGTEMWDSHPTRACNLAYQEAKKVLGDSFQDNTPPTIYKPQREPYNPGGLEWGSQPESSDFEIWTYAYDVSGLDNVTLYYSVALNQYAPTLEALEQRAWLPILMTEKNIPSQTNPKPIVKATEYSAKIEGLQKALVSYYVQATDTRGNVATSPMMFVYVGNGMETIWTPTSPKSTDVITIKSSRKGYLHWGVDQWKLPSKEYWPAGSVVWDDGKAIETEMVADGDGYSIKLGPFNKTAVGAVNFVFHYIDNTWDKDYTITIQKVTATSTKPVIKPATKPAKKPTTTTKPSTTTKSSTTKPSTTTKPSNTNNKPTTKKP